MDRTQADLELAILHVKQVEDRVSQQRERIIRLRADGFSTRPEEEQLAALLRALEMLKVRLANLTDPVNTQKTSN